MKREIAVGVIVGLLSGTGVLTAGAVFQEPAGMAALNSSATKSAVTVVKEIKYEKPLTRYKIIDERDLFRPALAKPKPVEKPIKVPPFNLQQPKPVDETPVEPPWTSPAEGWVYAGYAGIDGQMMGILQEPNSGQAVFIHQGEEFRGGKVEEVSENSIRLAFGEHIETLPKSDEFNAVPLDNGADGNKAGANQPRPGGRPNMGPGSAPPRRGNSNYPGASSMPSDIQVRAARMRAEFEARRQQMLQRIGRNNAPAPITNDGMRGLGSGASRRAMRRYNNGPNGGVNGYNGGAPPAEQTPPAPAQ